MAAVPYIPEIINNPLGGLWDLWQAYPLGFFSMIGVAPQGSKEQQVKAVSQWIPAAYETKTALGNKTITPPSQVFQKYITESKTVSSQSKEFWEMDTVPEAFPGQDLLGKYGKYVPIIIIAIVAIFLLPKLFKGDKD